MIWSDESAFKVGGLSSSGQVWVTRQAGEEDLEDCLVPKFKKLETILVWACFKGRQKGPLIFWDKKQWGKTVKAASFTSYIVPHFHQFWHEQSQLQLDYVYLQQDGASPHQAVHTQNSFRALGIWGYFIDWPPSSPDCNPIENLWRTLKQRIRSRNPFPTTNAALRTAIEEEWAAITPDELEALVDSLPTRLREVRICFSLLFSIVLTTSFYIGSSCPGWLFGLLRRILCISFFSFCLSFISVVLLFLFLFHNHFRSHYLSLSSGLLLFTAPSRKNWETGIGLLRFDWRVRCA